MIRVGIAGVTGWTGRAVAEAVESADDLELVFGVARSDPARFSTVAEALDVVDADVLVDYTHAAVVAENVRAAVERGVGVVVGSSGLGASDYEQIDALAREREVGVVAAGNFSLSAALVLRFATEAASHLEPADVLVDSMRGRYSTWTRVRVNLQNVPAELRPAQEALDPDEKMRWSS